MRLREGHTAYRPVLRQHRTRLSLAFDAPLSYVRARPTGFLTRSRVPGPQETAPQDKRNGALAGLSRGTGSLSLAERQILEGARAAFGLAGGSAIKTGGDNRLAGKYVS